MLPTVSFQPVSTWSFCVHDILSDFTNVTFAFDDGRRTQSCTQPYLSNLQKYLSTRSARPTPQPDSSPLKITQIWRPKKLFSLCRLTFYISSVSLSFFFEILGIPFSKLLCSYNLKLYRLQFKQLNDSCSKPQDSNTLQMN